MSERRSAGRTGRKRSGRTWEGGVCVGTAEGEGVCRCVEVWEENVPGRGRTGREAAGDGREAGVAGAE